MRILLIAAWLAAWPLSALAQDIQVQRMDVTFFGLYSVDYETSKFRGDTDRDVLHTFSNVEFNSKTHNIKPELGFRFGFSAILVGAPKGQVVELKRVCYYPKPGIKNPWTGKAVLREEYTINKTLGMESVYGYTFDSPWEMVPGQWIFEVWYGNKKLTSQTFTVEAPKP
jgi:hypothetical protein